VLGHPSIAQWGNPEWGEVVGEPSKFVKLESLARGEQQRTLTFDSVGVLLDADITAGFDSVASKDQEQSVLFDFFAPRVPTVKFLADCTANVLLIEMRLPAGTRRFATIPLIFGGDTYTGRLAGITTLTRTQGSGTDDVQVKLDDTDDGGQDRLRDVFLADDPEGSGVTIWVVLLGDKSKNRIVLFEGNIERVAGFSRAVVSIDVVRNEAVEDVELGRPITLAEFPNAPDDSLSKTRPIVFGQVENHESVAVDVNAIGRLDRALVGVAPVSPIVSGFSSVTTFVIAPSGIAIPQVVTPNDSILLRDADEFPSSGVVRIDDEEIAYTGKSGNELTGLTRSFNGTLFGEHTKGTEVQEAGDFQVLVADHPLGRIDNIKVLGSDDVLGEPVPAPRTVDNNAALITWSETPRVRNPNADAVFARIHFRDVDPLNKADGAAFTARENPSYRAFGFSRLGTGDMVLRTNTDGLGVPGDLVRVWIGCIFDPDTLGFAPAPPFISAGAGQTPTPNPAFSFALPQAALGIAGAASIEVTGRRFNLQPTDLVPEEIARNDEKTGDRIYDVPDPVFLPQIGRQGGEILSPDITIDPGIWQRDPPVGFIIDGDEDTEAVSFFAGFGEALFIGSGDAIFRLDAPPDIGDYKPVSGTLVFVAGWGPPFTPITSPMEVKVVNRFTGEIVAELLASSAAPIPPFTTGLINGIERFEAPIDVSLFNDDLSNLPDFDWIVSPILGVSSGLWVARELFIDLETVNDPPINSATINPLGSVTNYFEVTDLVGLSQTKDAAQDWAFFSDLNRGGRVTWRANIAGIDPQVLETFWVAEFTPFLNASTKVPRVFSDVRGITGPNGDDSPADISEQVITQLPPLGMGLGVSRISRGNYQAAKVSLDADGIRMGFAIVKPTSAVKLIEAIAEQGDCRQSWTQGQHNLIRRPRADTVLPVFKTLEEFRDILGASVAAQTKLGRTPLGEARTRVTAVYRIFAPTGDTSRSVEVVDAAAEVKFGRKSQTVTLDLVRDDVAAQVITARLVERRRRPRWTVELDMALPGLELRFGDLVAIEHKDIPGGIFTVCEVVGLNYLPAGFDRVRVTCVVWNE